MLEKLISKLNTCDLVKPLLPKEPIFITCYVNEKRDHYVLTNSGLNRCENSSERWNLMIRGAQDQLMELMKGELRLQQLMKLKVIQVEGKYRDILRLESILALSLYNSENSLTSDN
ncbi:hypothetical protein [Bacillus sp. FJAT-47783]|uniref:hypothetical protein n=1 Tax=Bacillus sp. FJAT-47783 TaxID=2922712 RepID=UPI001FAB89A0|nr:hypothetical protein [Bacillus sp. FJAT-47783]